MPTHPAPDRTNHHDHHRTDKPHTPHRTATLKVPRNAGQTPLVPLAGPRSTWEHVNKEVRDDTADA